MHRADATAVHRRGSFCHFVTNIAGLQHGTRLIFPVLWPKPALDSLLAITEDFAIGSIHSKWPFCWLFFCCSKHISTSIYGHFELFCLTGQKITLVEGLAETRRITRLSIIVPGRGYRATVTSSPSQTRPPTRRLSRS